MIKLIIQISLLIQLLLAQPPRPKNIKFDELGNIIPDTLLAEQQQQLNLWNPDQTPPQPLQTNLQNTQTIITTNPLSRAQNTGLSRASNSVSNAPGNTNTGKTTSREKINGKPPDKSEFSEEDGDDNSDTDKDSTGDGNNNNKDDKNYKNYLNSQDFTNMIDYDPD